MLRPIKKKKGMLLASEVLKIVIGVICIAFLVYLLFSLYFANSTAQETQEAQSTIKRVGDIITSINNGATASETIPNIDPVSWFVLGFVGTQQKPNLCAGGDCICICKGPSQFLFWTITPQIEQCDNSGVCTDVQNLKSFQSFEIKDVKSGGTTINITKSGKMIEVINQ